MEKLNNIWEVLPVWDKVEALESLGIKLDLSDEEQIDIAGQKAAQEKKDELEQEKKSKKDVEDYISNMGNPRAQIPLFPKHETYSEYICRQAEEFAKRKNNK